MIKKRILFINNSSNLGIGTSASLLLLLNYLHDVFDCAVVSDRHSSQLPKALEKLSIRHYALSDRFVLYLPALVKVILHGKYDLIYANGSNERSRGAFWAAKITGRSLIWHIRESLNSRKYVHTIHFANRVIANSNDTAERLRKFAAVPNPIVIPNGVDIREFDIDRSLARNRMDVGLGLEPDWLRIINVGNICPRKNQVDVISVAQEVVSHFPKTYFIMVGATEQDYLSELKSKVEQFDIQKNVLICDYTPDMGYYLCGSDLMLHTAVREPQGRVLLEAMAARLPVVAYNVGGVGEAVLDGQTGFLQPFGDLDGMARAVCRLITDPSERVHMGESGYRRVKENYSAENTAQSVREIINQVLEKK